MSLILDYIHDWHRVIFSDETKIKRFNVMVVFGVG